MKVGIGNNLGFSAQPCFGHVSSCGWHWSGHSWRGKTNIQSKSVILPTLQRSKPQFFFNLTTYVPTILKRRPKTKPAKRNLLLPRSGSHSGRWYLQRGLRQSLWPSSRSRQEKFTEILCFFGGNLMFCFFLNLAGFLKFELQLGAFSFWTSKWDQWDPSSPEISSFFGPTFERTSS